MNIILGFGSTETEQRKNLFKEIDKIVREEINNHDHQYGFDDEISKAIESRLEVIAKELREQDKEWSANSYKDAPIRYFYFYPTVCGDVNNIFIGVEYWHMNTNHGMSPDGIGLMIQKEAYWFKSSDF